MAVDPKSRAHDLLAVALGGLGLFLLLASPSQVDTSGPYPFYKGALIYPLAALTIMVLAALPAARRLLRPPAGAAWRVDGGGWPKRPLVVFGLLVGYAVGMYLVGLELSSFLFLWTTLFFLGHRRPIQLWGLTLAYTLLVVILFKYVLGVYFPTPLAADWLWG